MAKTDLMGIILYLVIIFCIISLAGLIAYETLKDDGSDDLVIKLENFESQDLTISDMGKIYFECIKYCERELGSYNAMDSCWDACYKLKEFVE